MLNTPTASQRLLNLALVRLSDPQTTIHAEPNHCHSEIDFLATPFPCLPCAIVLGIAPRLTAPSGISLAPGPLHPRNSESVSCRPDACCHHRPDQQDVDHKRHHSKGRRLTKKKKNIRHRPRPVRTSSSVTSSCTVLPQVCPAPGWLRTSRRPPLGRASSILIPCWCSPI